MELDELVEHWTLLVDEQELIAGERASTRLGFALLLKFYVRLGRFPRGRSELPDEAVAFVAKQAGVPPGELGFYEWSGSTTGYHRSQIRAYLGFRSAQCRTRFCTQVYREGHRPVPATFGCHRVRKVAFNKDGACD
jgi:hypothetical protein